MDKEKITIEISKRENSYLVIPKTEKHPDIPITVFSSDSYKIDNRYLLQAETFDKEKNEKKKKIFGIADDEIEANQRTYNKALEVANDLREWYLQKEKFNITIIDDVKNLESKVQ